MVSDVCSYRHSFWSKNRKKRKKTGVYPCRIGCRALVWAKAFLFYLYMTTFHIFFRPTDAALWHWFKFTWRLFLEENSSVPALRNRQHQQIRKFQAQGFKLIGNLRRPFLIQIVKSSVFSDVFILWFKWHTWWVCPRLLSSFVPFFFFETRSMATLSTR